MQKQDPKKALFEDLIWSRPENKRSAGKLLIIGGQAGNFINVSSAYTFAQEAGAGTIRLLMPDSLKKIAGKIDGAEFATSNSSGSFAKTALASFFELADWADHVLLAGDLGKSAETTVILDGFLLRGIAPTTIAQPALESIHVDYAQLANMPISLVIERKIFQKIGTALGTHIPITSITGFDHMAKLIEDISQKTKANYVIVDEEQIWCAKSGEVVVTRTKPAEINALSAYSSVWLMQNPTKPIEALATSIYESIN